jgi:precorrin-6B methylase 2
VVAYLKNNPVSVFPYPFARSYRASDVQVFKDESSGLHYVLMEEKKLYFKRSWSKQKIAAMFNSLRKEQDKLSPHRYLTDSFLVNPGDVIVDIGAAEGNFSLSVIERAGQVILFEKDEEWIEALRATFDPWKEKVIVVNKYVSDVTDETQVRLDDFSSHNPNFIKIDVEGSERAVLRGADKILTTGRNLKVALCSYHQQEDAETFDNMLKQLNFKTEFSRGYMLFYYNRKIAAPFLRRGLIRAIKN